MIKEVTYLLYFLILLAGIPVGIYLSEICSDEIKAWRKRLVMISLASFISLLVIFFIDLFINFSYKIPVMMTLVFIMIFCMTIFLRSR